MFSIIIPLYNNSATLERALQSIFSQSFQDFELIIINDGSTDNSLYLAKALTKDDQRCSVFSIKNSGVSEARNHGISKANCQYIAFLDSDDAWHERYLELMKELIQRHPNYNWWGSDYLKTTAENIRSVQISRQDYVIKDIQSEIVDYFEQSIHRLCIHIDSVIVRKSEIHKTGGFPAGVITGEDQDFFCRLALKSKLPYLPLQLTYYYEDAENRSCVAISKNRKDVPLFPFISENPGFLKVSTTNQEDKEFWVREYMCDRLILHAWRKFRFGYISRRLFVRKLLMCKNTRTRRTFLLTCFVLCFLPRPLHKALGFFYPKKKHLAMTTRT